MCDLHPNCASVSMLEQANVAPSEPSTALPPGLMALSHDEYAKTVRQCPIERYYDVSDTPISIPGHHQSRGQRLHGLTSAMNQRGRRAHGTDSHRHALRGSPGNATGSTGSL
ncbi:uncharacterized protein LOC119109775 [Pollicipes pollicipes]|uniref:uncharacterized protein LOC119109775 n=1 Tax=Pollicipes pollicipes TaxID=41117 RepID=UPI00188540EE|nr:uncharacterized protein LOC119109775 [Pollicipes pollicipes]